MFPGKAEAGQRDLHSLSSPVMTLHPIYHSGSGAFACGASATQYGCLILHAGAMAALNSCRSVPGMRSLRGEVCQPMIIHPNPACLLACLCSQFPCRGAVEEERPVWPKHKRYSGHCIVPAACVVVVVVAVKENGEVRGRALVCLVSPSKPDRERGRMHCAAVVAHIAAEDWRCAKQCQSRMARTVNGGPTRDVGARVGGQRMAGGEAARRSAGASELARKLRRNEALL